MWLRVGLGLTEWKVSTAPPDLARERAGTGASRQLSLRGIMKQAVHLPVVVRFRFGFIKTRQGR